MSTTRTLVIGDIHSGLKALHQVLDRSKVTEGDRLIFLGDYVDGWSQAVETIDFLIALNKSHNCIFIRGNHDELCLDWLQEGNDNPTWFQHGGRATMASYQNTTDEKIDEHMLFYQDLKNYFLEDERLFLHAGFTNLKGVDYEYMTKTFYWDRTLWELARSINPDLSRAHTRYPSRLKQYQEIFIGHTPLSKIGLAVPENAANVWNMDTGAAFKGPLSIMDIDTKEFWQSDPVHVLYPNEKGRN